MHRVTRLATKRRRATLLRALLAATAISTFLAGCAKKSGPWDRGEVVGSIALDGEPLQDGEISFHPISMPGTIAGTQIKDGKFYLPAHTGPIVGSNRIEIRSVQKTGRQVPATVIPEGDAVMTEGQLVEEYRDVVPPQYNRDSKLKYEIKVGKNEIDLALFSTDSESSPEAK